MWCHRRSSEKEDLLGLIIMCGPAASSCSTRCPRRRPQGRPKKQVRGGAQQWRGKKPAGARSAERWFAFLLFHRGLKLFGPQRVDPSCRARRRSSLRGLLYKCGRRYTQSRGGGYACASDGERRSCHLWFSFKCVSETPVGVVITWRRVYLSL